MQSNPPTCLSLIPKERTGGRIAHCAGKMDQQEPDKKRAVEDSGRTDDPVTNKAAKTEPDQDVSRRKEIREINRLAARECRAGLGARKDLVWKVPPRKSDRSEVLGGDLR